MADKHYAIVVGDEVNPRTLSPDPRATAIHWLRLQGKGAWWRNGFATVRDAFASAASKHQPPAYLCEAEVREVARLHDSEIKE